MQRRCFTRNRLASRVGTLITIVLTLWPSPAIVSAQRKSERELHVMAREIRRVNSVDGVLRQNIILYDSIDFLASGLTLLA